MRRYNVIFLEGVRKIGKSSQCVLLRQMLRDNGIETGQYNLDDHFSPSQLDVEVHKIRTWCKENPQGTLIVNGSLSYSIVFKDLQRQRYGSSYDEYELPIKNFLNLLREYKILNVLLQASDYSYLKPRYAEDEIYNPVEVKMLYDGFEFFENCQINNFEWAKVPITQYDSILQIHSKILKRLQ